MEIIIGVMGDARGDRPRAQAQSARRVMGLPRSADFRAV